MFAITFATVNVLPEPVTPNNTCDLSPREMPSVSCFMASGWSPVGRYFDVSLKLTEKEQVQDDFLFSRIDTLKKQSDLNAIMGHSQDKYMVTDKQTIMGNEINFSPRHISSVNSESDNCVVAGKINFLTEKTYNSKRKVKNKDGTEEPMVKPYFNFTLKDDSDGYSGTGYYGTFKFFNEACLFEYGNVFKWTCMRYQWQRLSQYRGI